MDAILDFLGMVISYIIVGGLGIGLIIFFIRLLIYPFIYKDYSGNLFD